MRIISKFTDYYDGVQAATGHDESLLYLRHTKTLNAWAKENRKVVTDIEINVGYIQGEFEVGIIGFCGKLYRYAQYRNYHDKDGNKLLEPRSREDRCLRKYFDFEHLVKAFPEFEKRLVELKNYRWRLWNGGTYIEKLGVVGENDSIFLRLGVPAFHFNPNLAKITDPREPGCYHQGAELVLNPNLKFLEFYRLISDYQAFQELEMYLGNILLTKEKEPEPLSDKNMVANKGFDPKYGFRKRKPEAEETQGKKKKKKIK